MQGPKSVILATFQKGPGWPFPVSAALTGFQKFFLFWVPMNIYKDWKAKLESIYSFMLKYSTITVCQGNETYEPSPCLVSTSSWYVGFVVGVILRTQYPLLPVRARPCIFVILGNHAMRGHKL